MRGDIVEASRVKGLRSRRRRVGRALEAMLERLEARLLLNGLTIITHGYVQFSSEDPALPGGWLTTMGNALASDMGNGTAIYKMTLGYNSSDQAIVTGFSLQQGASPTTSGNPNAEAVLLIDWTTDTDVIFPPYFSTTAVANAATSYLLNNAPALLQGAIQMIGHSRGASLVSAIARDLGQSGIWVDQLTTLDSHPYTPNGDPVVFPTSNVVFADNYYETQETLLDGVQGGVSVLGAVNVPLSFTDGSSNGHSDVHSFYYGTIDTSSSAFDGDITVPSSWYPANGVNRNSVGYDYSLVEGGTRPIAGIGTTFGGSAARAAVTTSGTQWADIGMLAPSTTNVFQGQTFSTTYDYQYAPGQSGVKFFLDTDQNPYNSGSVSVSNATILQATGNTVFQNTANLTASAAPGTYFLEAVITNGNQTRFSYDLTPIVIVVPTKVIFTQQPPASVVAGSILGPAITIDVTDDAGHLATSDNSNVTLTILGGSNGTTSISNQTVQAVNGVATFGNVSVTPSGNYTLQVSDGSLAPAISSAFTVTPDLTTARLFPLQQPGNAVVGQPFASALSVEVVDQYGNVVSTELSQVTVAVVSGPGILTGMTTATVSNGVATFSGLGLTEAGAYTLAAADSSLAITTPVQFGETITQGVTTVPSPQVNQSYTFGQAITFSDTLTSTAGITIPWTGVATVEDQNRQVVANATVSSGGVVNFALPALVPGNYVYTIVYPGDTNHTSGISSNFTMHVIQASTTTVLTPSSTQFGYGQTLTLTARVTSVAGTPTGNVTFWDGSTNLGIIALNGNSTAALPAFTPLADVAGQAHNYTATYSGDNDFVNSSSGSSFVTVFKNSPMVTLNFLASSSVAPGQTSTLIVRLSPLASGKYTGSVPFFDRGTPLGGNVAVSFDGVATLPNAPTSIGTHLITAQYLGDANNNANVSNNVKLKVVKGSSNIAIIFVPTSIASAGGAQFIVSVTSASSSLTGTVQLFAGSQKVGSAPVVIGQQTVLTVSAVLRRRSYLFKVKYSGDKDNLASNVNIRNLTVS